MSKNLKLVKRIASVATAVCVVAGMMVSASAYGITEPAGGFVYDGTQESITVPVTGTNTSGQVTIVVRTEGDAWLTDPNANVVFIDQVTGADSSTSITFGIDSKWLSAPGTYKIYVGGSSQAVTSANLIIDPNGDPVVLESIAVAADAKTAYTVGDTFVAPKVTGTYSNGSTATVEATFTGYDMATPGTQTVTVAVGNVTTTYEITVAPKPPIGDDEVAVLTQYRYAYDLADKAVVEAKLADADNGNKKIMVGTDELFYSVERGLYVGVISTSYIEGSTIKNAVITAEAPTLVVYGNVDNSAVNASDPKSSIKNGDLVGLKFFMAGTRAFEPINYIAADVTGDGRVVNGDLVGLKFFMQNGQEFTVLGK